MANPNATLAAFNRNPLNLRPLPSGEKWQGQTGVSANTVSGRFCQFVDNKMGVRAAVINMRSIMRLPNHTTLLDLIRTWAPAEDNNSPSAYANSVASTAGIDVNTPIASLFDNNPWPGEAELLAKIVIGMNRVEAGGQTVTLDEVYAGINLALNLRPGYARQDDGNIIRTDVKQSEVVKAADNGMVGILSTAGGSVAVPIVGALAGAPPLNVAIIVGVILVVGLAVGAYFLMRARKVRIGAHDDGVA